MTTGLETLLTYQIFLVCGGDDGGVGWGGNATAKEGIWLVKCILRFEPKYVFYLLLRLYFKCNYHSTHFLIHNKFY